MEPRDGNWLRLDPDARAELQELRHRQLASRDRYYVVFSAPDGYIDLLGVWAVPSLATLTQLFPGGAVKGSGVDFRAFGTRSLAEVAWEQHRQAGRS